MNAVLALIFALLNLYKFFVFLYVILSWLVGFQVINTRNRLVFFIWDALTRMVEPACGWLRRYIPPLGGIDISPLILLLVIMFIQRLMVDSFGYQITYL